jgi:hypothetical protein
MKPFLSMMAIAMLLASGTFATAQAQTLKLSPMVHSAPPGGYNFQALVPLPSMMPDEAMKDDNAIDVQKATFSQNNGQPPVTTLELKKKQ